MKIRFIITACLSFFMAVNMIGCASGVSYKDYQGSMTKLNSEQSRLIIYRTAVIGAAIQPKVYLDEEVVCKAVPKGFAYKDVAPGDHQINCSTEVKRSLSLTTKPGQTKYVRLDVTMGFFAGHVSPVPVEEADALNELNGCKYIGK
ncbi:MAG: DUF2846 domain-containing protein [Sedimentisphaerales bacterium]|nr:DUF2846 domain-containing protein [Sedimentisphaerales bacterium]MBN2843023.1 DUF2846 domain-containing protein [Sedimentisphaerales bacterium]